MKKLRKLMATGIAALSIVAFNQDVEASFVQDFPDAGERIKELLTTSSEGGWIGTEEEVGIENMSDLINEVNTSNYDSIYLKNWIYYPTSGNIKFNYHLTTEEINDVKGNLYKDVDEVLNEIIPNEASDFQKVLAIHDYIVMNVQYDESWLDDPKGVHPSVHTADGAFYNNVAVCGGYANLMSLMLDKVEIENNYILGYLKESGGYHAWNQVNVDGEWYYVDATWNDPYSNKEGQVIYDYFLISEEDLKNTHTWKSEYYPDTGNKYDYMRDMTNFNRNPLQIKDGYIYYSSKSENEALHRVKLDGTGKERLTNGRAPYFVIAGNQAYLSNYSYSGNLYRINIVGPKNARNLKRAHVRDLSLNGDYLEYLNVTNGKTERLKVK